MKKLLLSIIALASLTSQARPSIDENTKSNHLDTAGYCSQYNETALRTIYKKLISTDISKMRAQLIQNQIRIDQCAELYKRAAFLGQENVVEGAHAVQVYDDCAQNLLSQQQIRNTNMVINAIIEAISFKTEETYVAFHTRDKSPEACAASYRQTQTLKILLSL